MAGFVQLSPDPFATNFENDTKNPNRVAKNQNYKAGTGAGKGFEHVRRPVRGIQIKEDTYATIQVRTSLDRLQPLIDAGGSLKDGNFAFSTSYSNFLIQAINETRQEKQQIVETFGEPYFFFFGEHPRMLQIQGVLLNSEDFNWRAEFLENYERYLRGTRCVQNKTRVYLSWDTVVVEGYVTNVNIADTADNKEYVTFSFQMILTNYQDVSNIGDSTFPVPSNFQLSPEELESNNRIAAPTGDTMIESLKAAVVGIIDPDYNKIQIDQSGYSTIDQNEDEYVARFPAVAEANFTAMIPDQRSPRGVLRSALAKLGMSEGDALAYGIELSNMAAFATLNVIHKPLSNFVQRGDATYRMYAP